MYRNSAQSKPQPPDNLAKKKNLQKVSPRSQPSKLAGGFKSSHAEGNVRNKENLGEFSLKDNGTPTDFINNAIYEYLHNKGMNGTLEKFRSELNHGSHDRKSAEPHREGQLLEFFDKGQRESFFKKWNSSIPAHFRATDDFCSKLEFYLHLYFAIFNIHPFTKKTAQKGAKVKSFELDKQEVQHFKHYLDSNGDKFAQTNEFLQYFALPYIPNPLTHPSLKDVFTYEWPHDLRDKLQNFLLKMDSSDQLPVLYQLYNSYKQGGSKTTGGLNLENGSEYAKVIAQLETSNQGLMNILQEYNEKYEGLVKNYEIVKRNEEVVRSHLVESNVKWINFLKEVLLLTTESLQVIETQRNGVTVSKNVFDILKNKLQNYENFLHSNQEELFSTSQDNSFIEKVSISQDHVTPDHSTIIREPQTRSPNEEKSVNYIQNYPSLNFEKIKSFLVNKNNTELSLCTLIQALGWRITKTQAINLRREVVVSYSKNDLLDLHRKEPCVLESLTSHSSKRVREHVARLINILTLDYSGRSYLLGSDKLVVILIDILKQEEGDTSVRKNCLGALQKLSLRRRPQLLMIEQDMIRWITLTLKKEKDTLSEYSYEYATALFMNLSLRSFGKKKCEELELEVLKVLNDLLEHENMQVRSFVNGTLYSLLSKSVFKEHANALGMKEVLEYLMENSDERYRKQIQYILDQLNSDKTTDDDEDAQSDTNDEDNDYDDMEDEDDFGEDEYIEDNINNPNVLTGEDLLKKHFSLSGPSETQNFNYTIAETMNESRSQILTQHIRRDPHSPLSRPITPSKLTKILQQENASLNVPEGFETKQLIPRTPLEVTKEDFYGNSKVSQFEAYEYGGVSRKSGSQQQRLQDYTNQPSYFDRQPENNSRRNSKKDEHNTSHQKAESLQDFENRPVGTHLTEKQQKSAVAEEEKPQAPEFVAAFSSKPKLARSPPENAQRKR